MERYSLNRRKGEKCGDFLDNAVAFDNILKLMTQLRCDFKREEDNLGRQSFKSVILKLLG